MAGHYSGIKELKKHGLLPDGGDPGDVLMIDENGDPVWVSSISLGIGGVPVTVINGIATFVIGENSYSWPVIGPPGDVIATGAIHVSVSDGVATLTGSGLDHSFPVFGTPGTAAAGVFTPSVSDGIASFVLGTTTYAFVVVQS